MPMGDPTSGLTAFVDPAKGCDASVVWDDRYLDYDFGDHPMHPVRLDLTIRLARELGVLEPVTLRRPDPCSEQALLTAHTPQYLAALREASVDSSFVGFGLGTADDPVFPRMFEIGSLIAGGSLLAASDVWTGRAEHSVNIAGGLHHAMRNEASGFCLINDVVVAIQWLLDNGAERVAYVDVDVHHGDGVQKAFYSDPRVLTVSVHQHPATLFPGTGLATEVGDSLGLGTSVNLPLPPGTTDDDWLRAFSAVVPSAVRAFKPDILITQCGCDTHHDDPLADMKLTVDGQRAAFQLLHGLAHEVAGGKWVALGGGGYGVLRCVPRTWTNLIAEASGRPLDPRTEIPAAWIEHARSRGAQGDLPLMLGEGRTPDPRPWDPGNDSWLDRSITGTRRCVFPLLGLDPDDPRD